MIKTGQAARARRDLAWSMMHSDYRDRVRKCPTCGRVVRLNREGRYRRHYATERDGRLRLCAASYARACAAPGLDRLDL